MDAPKTAYQVVIDLLNTLSIEDMRNLSTVVEERIEHMEQIDNGFNKELFAKAPFLEMVEHSKFKTRFSPAGKLEGLSVEYDDLDIEYEILAENVTISVFLQGFGDDMVNSWDLSGTPDEYVMFDSCYDANPKTQQPIPKDMLVYAVFLWREFLKLIES